MKMLTPRQFMSEKKTGLLVRGFATKASDVPARVQLMDELTQKSLASVVEGKPFIAQVDILIWANQNDYPTEADCGELAPALKEHFRGNRRVKVHEVTSGDLFCAILNYGIAMQVRDGCDYTVVASAEANAYWDSDVPAEMVRLAGGGARAIGVAINELTDSVMAGRIANTMAMWRNIDLLSVGGFDMKAAKPKNDREAHYMKGVAPDGSERYYHLGGVEEVIPLARMVDLFGACIGVIESKDPALRYVAPNQQQDPQGYGRYLAKFGTKSERQMAHLVSVGRDFSHLAAGVMNN